MQFDPAPRSDLLERRLEAILFRLRRVAAVRRAMHTTDVLREEILAIELIVAFGHALILGERPRGGRLPALGSRLGDTAS